MIISLSKALIITISRDSFVRKDGARQDMANFGMGWTVWLHGNFLCGFKSEIVLTLMALTCSIEGNQPVHPYRPNVTWTALPNWPGIFPHRSETAPTQIIGAHAENIPQMSLCLLIIQTIAARVFLAVRTQTVVSPLPFAFVSRI